MRKLLFILFVVIAAVALYFYFNPHIAQHLPQNLRDQLPQPGETTAYKWRDAQGRWQLTDIPPENGIDYETVTVDRDTNILPADAFSKNKAD